MTHGGPISDLCLGALDLVWSFVPCASPVDLVDRPKRTLFLVPTRRGAVYCCVIFNMILHKLGLDFGMLALLFA
jgi:hypothetical protein